MARFQTGYSENDIGCYLNRISLIFCLLFLFFLPLYEAPKNIFSVLFVFSVGVFSFSSSVASWVKLIRKMNIVTWAFLLLALSPFIAGFNSPYLELGERFASALNWSLMPLIAVVLLISNLSRYQIVLMLRVMCLSTVIAAAQAFYQWDDAYPELNSVGHVNQSALYLAFSLIPAGLLVLYRQHWTDVILIGITVLTVGWYQGPAKSMIGFGSSILVIGGFWVLYCINRRHIKILGVSGLLGVISVVTVVNIPVSYFGIYENFMTEFHQRLSPQSDLYSQRGRLVNSALEVGGKSLTGFGLGSFGDATQLMNIKSAVEARGGDWASEKRNFLSSSHGHNIFANVLVERGWVGVFTIVAFLVTVLIVFLQRIRLESSQAGVITVLIICLAGLGQSTLHVEHGQLAFIGLALCLKLIFAEQVPRVETSS